MRDKFPPKVAQVEPKPENFLDAAVERGWWQSARHGTLTTCLDTWQNPKPRFSFTKQCIAVISGQNIYAFTFHNGRLRILRVMCTVLPPKLFPPNASTTVSSAPAPRAIPRFRISIASLANLKRAWSDPVESTSRTGLSISPTWC